MIFAEGRTTDTGEWYRDVALFVMKGTDDVIHDGYVVA